LLGISFPTISTYIYFDLLSSASPSIQKGAYVVAKLLQFMILVAAIYLWRIKRRSILSFGKFDEKPSRSNGMLIGFATGLAMGGSILAIHHFILAPLGIMEPVKIAAKQKLQGFGADSPLVLLGIAIFYAAFHSGFEELYWRGFVFKGLNEHFSLPVSVVCSSLGFMSHHVIVLAKYFGYGSIFTYVSALGVAIGGAIWAVLFVHYGRLSPSWLSHAMVDGAIFAVGFLLLFR